SPKSARLARCRVSRLSTAINTGEEPKVCRLTAGGRWIRTVGPAHRIPRSLSRKGEMPKGRTCVDLLHGLIFPTVVIKQHRRQPSRGCWRAECGPSLRCSVESLFLSKRLLLQLL